METKADKIAAIAMGILFLFGGVGSLFTLPAHWPWYLDAMFAIMVFGCSLMCFSAVLFGVPGSRK